MTRTRGGRYRETEVRAYIEEYAVALEDRDTTERGLRTLVAVADLKLAYRRLSLTSQDMVLVCGVLGVPVREAAGYFEKSKSWVAREYVTAIKNLTYEMNGGRNG
jgi:hypothetical protein